MSADLFAEFSSSGAVEELNTNVWVDQAETVSQHQVTQPHGQEEEDDFGAFEAAGRQETKNLHYVDEDADPSRSLDVAGSVSAFQSQSHTLNDRQAVRDPFGAFGLAGEEKAPNLHHDDEDTDAWQALDVLEPNSANQSQQHTLNNQPDVQDQFGTFKTAGEREPRRFHHDDEDTDAWQAFDVAEPASAAQLPSHTIADRQEASVHFKPRNLDVLFDAEDSDEDHWDELLDDEEVKNEDEDDFGDFEESESATVREQQPSAASNASQAAPPVSASMDLLSLDDEPPIQTVTPSKASVPATQTRPRPTQDLRKAPRAAAPVTQHSTSESKHALESNTAQTTDDWDDFDPSPEQESKASKSLDLTIPLNLISPLLTPTPPTPSTLPPSSIPPPSLLISLFPPLYSTLSTTFLQPLTSLHPSERQTTFLTPEVASILHGTTILSATLARLIAGRKQRWKRDKVLAQSMSISSSGPAAGSRGMKLAGLDKSEERREDVEVSNALQAWKGVVGRLRSVVAGFNAAVNNNTPSSSAAAAAAVTRANGGSQGPRKAVPNVPDLAAVMAVRRAGASEGAVVSLHACGLCGLKREERVAKIDGNVEDSFGEWWLEGPSMHVSCWAFWQGYKDRLRSR